MGTNTHSPDTDAPDLMPQDPDLCGRRFRVLPRWNL
jgi:hypothetical protein